MSNRTSEPRRALVLVGTGNASPAYDAIVEIDGIWAHLRDVTERGQRRSDRTLRAGAIREIRWVDQQAAA